MEIHNIIINTLFSPFLSYILLYFLYFISSIIIIIIIATGQPAFMRVIGGEGAHEYPYYIQTASSPFAIYKIIIILIIIINFCYIIIIIYYIFFNIQYLYRPYGDGPCDSQAARDQTLRYASEKLLRRARAKNYCEAQERKTIEKSKGDAEQEPTGRVLLSWTALTVPSAAPWPGTTGVVRYWNTPWPSWESPRLFTTPSPGDFGR